MTPEGSILSIMREANRPLSASEIASALCVPKTDVNSILYSMDGVRFNRSATQPPYWAEIPLEEQVVAHLSETPTTASAIAEALHVPKTIVNSVLYRIDGLTACHDDSPRPNWYLKDACD